jgi:HlyD family secretion protein
MARGFKYLFTLALPLAAAAGAAAWMMGMGGLGGSGDGAMSYDTVEVGRGEIRRLVTTSGTVRAVVTVSIGSQLSGQIDTLRVDFNSEVKSGDLLARIDDKTYAARVAQARADLTAAQAGLANQQAARVKSEAVLRNAKRLLERQETLSSKGVASAATLDTAIRDVDVAVADIAVVDAQIQNAKATIAQREAALRASEIDLERTQIRSPIDGTVISRTIDIGQTVAASLQAPELFKIAQDLRRIQIEAQVNEADVGAIKEGNPAEFTVDAYPDDRFHGVVTQVRLAATELQSVVTYTVIIEAANDDRRLYPGMTANVQIETARRRNILRIPNDALRFKPRETAATSPAAPQRGGAQAAERGERMVEQMRTALKLTDSQVDAVNEAIKQSIAARAARQKAAEPDSEGQGDSQSGERRPGEARKGGEGSGSQNAGRNRFMERIEAALEPTLTDEQKPLLDRWRKARQVGRMATLYTLAANGEPEQRQVRLGIGDEQYVELINGLKESDRVVTRARSAKAKR